MLSSDLNDDFGWGQAHATGATNAAEATGAELTIAENVVTPAEIEQQGAAFVDQGYAFIGVSNGGVPDSVMKLANENPDVVFCGAAMAFESMPENLCTYYTQAEIGAFFAGAVAGLTTKTDHVGTIAGFNFGAINWQTQAYILGARYVNGDVTSSEAYLDSLIDVAKGEAAAQAQIASGADVILSATGLAQQGIIAAAGRTPDTYMIAQYADASEQGPEVVLGSALHFWDGATQDIFEKGIRGELESKTYVYGIEDGVGTFVFNPNLSDVVPPAAEPCLAALDAMVRSGELEIPTLEEQGLGQAFDLATFPEAPGECMTS